MKRIAEENDFEGQRYSSYIGVSPEVTLTYLYGEWIADMYYEGQDCYFVGKNDEEITDIISKETGWHTENFSGSTAYDALHQMDIVCKKLRQHHLILTADVERD